jgi:hypothetical protein
MPIPSVHPNLEPPMYYRPEYGISVLNHLPPNIKSLSNEVRLFKPAPKRFLLSNSYYYSDEYFNSNFNSNSYYT